jgi:D-alanyl-D-alanine carboxypeptidase (penicillin-binding protein 5/6)
MKRLIPLFLIFAIFSTSLPVSAAETKKKTTTTKTSATKKPGGSSSSAAKKKTIPEAPAVDENGVPRVTAGSAIVVDAATGDVLHSLNADQRRPVASTQKLLTALLVAEEGDLDHKVRVEASDTWAEPTKLYIKPGEVYSRSDFLNILLVRSMNDVARALARDNAGSVEAFADKMNARAAQIGMRESNFVNPNGLPATGQYSTARDMARLALVAYRNRTLRSIMAQKSITWHYPNGRVTTFSNTNAVLKNFGPCNGMKTGTTNAAGRCLISSASYGGRDIIVVVLGDNSNVWRDSYRLLAWGLGS